MNKTKFLLNMFGVLIIFIVITGVFAFFDFGKDWSSLGESFFWDSYGLLILYRFCIYFIPGIVLWKINSKYGLSLVDTFEIQFAAYSTVKIVWEFFALDYIWSTEIFDKLDTAIVLIGLLLSIIYKNRVNLKTTH